MALGQALVNWLLLGSFYAAVALGFSLVWSGPGIRTFTATGHRPVEEQHRIHPGEVRRVAKDRSDRAVTGAESGQCHVAEVHAVDAKCRGDLA